MFTIDTFNLGSPLGEKSGLALWASRSRRSRLLRPDRFVISADDPEHLVGRDEEVKELAKACEQNALVFLQGESGAGKSALVLGGLLPHYQATRAGTDAPRLLPIRIDASPLSWDNDLRVELARALRDVSAEEQVRLGATTAPGSGDPFSWLAALPIDAPCQVLLVVDQIDDYAVAHQARFVRGHTVVAPEQFEEANADWAAIGSLVRKGSIHLLIVCRADAAGILDALRFTRARTILLPRIDRHDQPDPRPGHAS
jgi:energy-coupling factor transporter ATP-binding protein EcfA2